LTQLPSFPPTLTPIIHSQYGFIIICLSSRFQLLTSNFFFLNCDPMYLGLQMRATSSWLCLAYLLRWGLANFLLWLASCHESLDLHLSRNWNCSLSHHAQPLTLIFEETKSFILQNFYILDLRPLTKLHLPGTGGSCL
jgi:hypothetical protein